MRHEIIEDLAAINKNIAIAQKVAAQTTYDDFKVINKIIIGLEQIKEMLHNKTTEHVFDQLCVLCLKLSAVVSALEKRG